MSILDMTLLILVYTNWVKVPESFSGLCFSKWNRNKLFGDSGWEKNKQQINILYVRSRHRTSLSIMEDPIIKLTNIVILELTFGLCRMRFESGVTRVHLGVKTSSCDDYCWEENMMAGDLCPESGEVIIRDVGRQHDPSISSRETK